MENDGTGIGKRQMWEKALHLEEELRKSKKSILDRSNLPIRNSLRDIYANLLLSDLEFALEKEVDSLMWKTVFYRPVEEYRKKTRSLMQTSHKEVTAETMTVKDQLQKINASLRSFLSSAISFYNTFLGRLREKYHLVLDGSVEYNPSKPVHRAYRVAHQCFIYLGDLARYYRMPGEETSKNWKAAEEYYNRAIRISPYIGNAHNQLGVFFSYLEDELASLYHYFRALAAEVSFASASDNLRSLFERNRKNLEAYLQASPAASPASTPSPPQLRILRKHEAAAVPAAARDLFAAMLMRFARIHGVLFTRTSVQQFDALNKALIRDFNALTATTAAAGAASPLTLFTFELLLRLVFVAIFSHHWAAAEKVRDEVSTPPTMAEVAARAQLMSLSYRHILSLLSLFLRLSLNHPPALGPTSLLCAYLTLHPAHVPATITEEADKEAWKHLCRALVTIANECVAVPAPEAPSNGQRLSLPEEKEARGFVPLKALYSALAADTGLSAEEERAWRCQRITAFARLVSQKIQTPRLLYYTESADLAFSLTPPAPVCPSSSATPPPNPPTLATLSPSPAPSPLPELANKPKSSPHDQSPSPLPPPQQPRSPAPVAMDEEVEGEEIVYQPEPQQRQPTTPPATPSPLPSPYLQAAPIAPPAPANSAVVPAPEAPDLSAVLNVLEPPSEDPFPLALPHTRVNFPFSPASSVPAPLTAPGAESSSPHSFFSAFDPIVEPAPRATYSGSPLPFLTSGEIPSETISRPFSAVCFYAPAPAPAPVPVRYLNSGSRQRLHSLESAVLTRRHRPSRHSSAVPISPSPPSPTLSRGLNTASDYTQAPRAQTGLPGWSIFSQADPFPFPRSFLNQKWYFYLYVRLCGILRLTSAETMFWAYTEIEVS